MQKLLFLGFLMVSAASYAEVSKDVKPSSKSFSCWDVSHDPGPQVRKACDVTKPFSVTRDVTSNDGDGVYMVCCSAKVLVPEN